MEKLFEKIYNSTHIVKLNELTSEFIKTKIKRAIANGNSAVEAGTAYGKIFAMNPTANPLNTSKPVVEGSNIEYFSKSPNADRMNTILAETFYLETLAAFKDDPQNRKLVKSWFEAFYNQIKKAGIPFAPFKLLNVA
jgi:hypothetical protein